MRVELIRGEGSSLLASTHAYRGVRIQSEKVSISFGSQRVRLKCIPERGTRRRKVKIVDGARNPEGSVNMGLTEAGTKRHAGEEAGQMGPSPSSRRGRPGDFTRARANYRYTNSSLGQTKAGREGGET